MAYQPVLVTIDASEAINTRPAGGRPWYLPMRVEFASGLRFELRPGRNQVFVPPGRYRVQLWSQFTLGKVGKATLDIDTTRGPVWFHYATPHSIYSAGAAGFHPQDRPGSTVLLMVSAGAVLITVLAVVMAVVLTQ
ncbi:hypothetical protein AB0M45_26875 [Nocardia sp. NPDC051787]|uniref:hypothetical protein n=1 Tax=Nocardia sp. NPDC051787 TaxID=3155415 RepID=UPI0034293965